MSNHFSARWICVGLCFATLVHAAPEPATKVEDGQLQAAVGFSIDVIAVPKNVEQPGTFQIAFLLQNPSANKLVLQDFVLRSIESTTPLEVDEACKKTAQKAVEAKNAVVVACSVTAPGYEDTFTGFFTLIFSRWSLLTFTPGDYRFVAVATSRVQAEQDSVVVMTSKAFSVHLTPTIWQVIAGAMLGSLLTVMFWGFSPHARSISGFPYEHLGLAPRLARTIGTSILLWCGSTAAAAIAIFLTFRLKDAALPFTISVNDFYGGLVVGLFGVFLTGWLRKRLFTDEDSASAETRDRTQKPVPP
ncbi:hypothetical protein [Paucibacter sp. KBW04]|uniref:hypothetical protein n=1 Tax=Paucibacter sp. KBW04 TaxID=2153361 RepID=UPI000F5801EA|nr:hypothetical protein [Paucibacter sp. KBW04]